MSKLDVLLEQINDEDREIVKKAITFIAESTVSVDNFKTKFQGYSLDEIEHYLYNEHDPSQ